jgi:triacylglycerol lipase
MPLPTKALPAPSLTLLFFPQRDPDYIHFEHAEAVPFDPEAAAFSASNAWYLADAALLAYWEPAEASARFARGGFIASEFFDNPKTSTECYVAASDRAAIVSFRGTQINAIQDAVADANALRVVWDGEGHVHRGFLAALDAVWQPLDRHLHALGRRTIWMTGHSLGAALATLAARRWIGGGGAIAGVYTVGSPRVGDHDFAAGFDRVLSGKCFRYANGVDSVTDLPLAQWGYVHVGEERRFAPTNDGHPLLQGLEAPLVDHTPRRYATLVWNALAQTVEPIDGGVARA